MGLLISETLAGQKCKPIEVETLGEWRIIEVVKFGELGTDNVCTLPNLATTKSLPEVTNQRVGEI